MRSIALGLLAAPAISFAAVAPDWSETAKIPLQGRSNPYGVAVHDLDRMIDRGKFHALQYPVETTGVLAPLNPLKKVLGSQLDGLMGWLGLIAFPAASSQKGIPVSSPYFIPMPKTATTHGLRMGAGVIDRSFSSGRATGMTVSCAACHASELFGRPVLGLSNRFPRANEFFRAGKIAVRATLPAVFRSFTGATRAETELFRELRQNSLKIEAKKPEALGLDTSLAHVALSLSTRNGRDPEPLRTEVADSKPAPWFTLKYKTRWLLDGSVLSGNPILTNLLWNEIGRGSDLDELSLWLDRNESTIQELTTAVFSTEAPKFTDFFPAEKVPLAQAKAGEAIFNQNCASCHGTYLKAWHRPESPDSLETLEVRYHTHTPVRDVGTDSSRREGMKSLAARLNPLPISKKYGIRIQPQKGYVPPPLVGIWSRWPYFHNNSVPSLCQVLTSSKYRSVTYWSGPAQDPSKDFDSDCNGYPVAAAVPSYWKTDSEKLFDTRKSGLGNQGHDEGIVSVAGKDRFTAEQKRQLIRFLQTL